MIWLSVAIVMKILPIGAALFLMVGAASATVTFYTSSTNFAAATSVGTTYVDGFKTSSGGFSGGFTDTQAGGGISSPLARTNDSFSYTVTVPVGTIYVDDYQTVRYLGTDIMQQSMTVSGLSSTMHAAAGNFFLMDNYYAFISDQVSISVTDASGTYSYTLTPATVQDSFLGFSSDTGILSYTVSKLAVNDNWVSIANLTFATVPEASSLALVATGLLGLAGRRRR